MHLFRHTAQPFREKRESSQKNKTFIAISKTYHALKKSRTTFIAKEKSSPKTRTFIVMHWIVIRLYSEEQPDNDVRGNNGCKGERNTDLKEVTVLDRVSFLAQNADTRDIGRCTDGRAVTAKRCT